MTAASETRFGQIGDQLSGVGNCPYCGVAHPSLIRLWSSANPLERATKGPTQMWAVYRCTSCGGAVLAKGKDDDRTNNAVIAEVIPGPRQAHADIPEPARTFLQQAYQTLQSPDAAAMLAGSTVDAMLKMLGYSEGSVYARIEQAVRDHKITEDMGKWAHEVRLGSNRPRHADDKRPHVSTDEAKQSVEFTEALGYFLFVLTKQAERGTQAAVDASATAT
jgi:DNA-directed RNA polymerase subunit RPC12/RpoP